MSTARPSSDWTTVLAPRLPPELRQAANRLRAATSRNTLHMLEGDKARGVDDDDVVDAYLRRARLR